MVSVSKRPILRRGFGRVNWLGLGVCLLVLVLWQLVVDLKILDYNTVPSPTEVIDKGFQPLIDDGLLQDNLVHTLRVVLIAWAIAVVLGTIFGLALGLLPFISKLTMASIDVLRSLPVIAFVPIVLLVWGPAAKSEVYIASWAALWPMLINTSSAVRSISPRMTDVARTFRLSTLATLYKVVLPSIGPSVLVGARLAMGVALILTIVFEMIGSPFGLGFGMVQAEQALQPEQMWAYMLTIGTLGAILNALLVVVSRKLFPGVSQLERGDA